MTRATDLRRPVPGCRRRRSAPDLLMMIHSARSSVRCPMCSVLLGQSRRSMRSAWRHYKRMPVTWHKRRLIAPSKKQPLPSRRQSGGYRWRLRRAPMRPSSDGRRCLIEIRCWPPPACCSPSSYCLSVVAISMDEPPRGLKSCRPDMTCLRHSAPVPTELERG